MSEWRRGPADAYADRWSRPTRRAGDSIAINGVCLTVTRRGGGEFSADVMGETLDRSSLGALTPGSAVNLERPLRPDGRLGGHIVQGHVDGTGTIAARQPAERLGGGADLDAASDWPVTSWRKGSVAVDGVSLTVSAPRATASQDPDPGSRSA